MADEPPHLPPTDEALEKLIDSLTARFPADHAEVETIVRRSFADVSSDAPVDAYLLHLAEGKARDELLTRYPAHRPD